MNNQTALIIGNGMAGLLAARVLADHFAHVTVVERDTIPDTPIPRKGVPQAHQLHNLVVRGCMILDQLFPGLHEQLTAAGASLIEWPSDMLWLGKAGWSPRFRTGLTSYSCTRYLLEWGVRAQLKATFPNVSILEKQRVNALVANQDNTRIIGVQLQTQAENDAETSNSTSHTLSADLVVDASGRTSQTPKWLASLGYPEPTQTTINPHVGYASRYYETPDGFAEDWKVLLVQSRPPENNRAGASFVMENNLRVVTLVGVGKDYPPTDDQGFLDFARSLPTPRLAEFISHARPATPLYGYRIPYNRQIHYERMARWPDGFVVLGDAVCSFNPTYGQGMTVSGEGVLALDACMREQRQRHPSGALIGLGRRFQQKLSQVIATPWTFTTGEDSRYPTTEGSKQDPQTKMMQWLLDGVMLYAIENKEMHRTLVEVMHMVKSPEALLRPDFVLWSTSLQMQKRMTQTLFRR